MEHFHVPLMHCPVCDHVVNCHGATAPTIGPRPGDFTLCVYCGMLLSFGFLGELRVCSEGELASITSEERARIEQARAHVLAHPELRED